MIDSHCHLDAERFVADLPAVLERARAAGISAMICIGSGRDLGSARAAARLSEQEADVYATVGIHPHDVATMGEADWSELAELALRSRVVGVGETGLDYYYEHSPREAQRSAYRRFIALARAVHKPLSSHIRDAHQDAAEILREERAAEVGGVIHCFTGDVDDARRYLDLGHHLSFSGILTFKNAEAVRAAAVFAPLDRVLVETDAPYLAPIPHRGKRNEPAFVSYTVQTLADLRGIAVEAARAATAANARRLFALADSYDATVKVNG
jgi:TatD DNase family protein